MTHAPNVRQSARQLSQAGSTTAEIAASLGISVKTVALWKREGFRPAISASARPKGAGIIPRWVPDELREEYLARAKVAGEEDAACWARRAKRELARQVAE